MKKGKIVLIVVVAFLAIGVVSGIIHNVTGTTPESAESSNQNTANDDEDGTTSEEIVVSDFLARPDFNAEQNTSEMIDKIAATAKANVESMTDEQADEIVNAISEADHNFYNGPEEMEKYMWYGYLLDYKYDDSDPRSTLGTDLCQAIKYVYRNDETVLDDATHENLLQIDEDLESIQ
ncbi:MAG TPA: hypothetical protein H9695_13645 [Candidatus Mediterraneibacter excrementigallinarum]|nr:hypothetical protein [Candidatus Mediterraneibacter excrementigallinarum]